MARIRKVTALLTSDKEDREWIAATTEAPRLEQRHPNPSTAINNLSEALRRELGEDIELEYEVKLPSSLQSVLHTLQLEERELKELSERVKQRRYEFASRCIDRRMKQHDIAELMNLSQSYVNTVIRTKGQVTMTGTGERILSRRRRNDL